MFAGPSSAMYIHININLFYSTILMYISQSSKITASHPRIERYTTGWKGSLRFEYRTQLHIAKPPKQIIYIQEFYQP